MIFTIGHSTHTREQLAQAARGIDRIIDVRSHPTSRWEQHRKEQLEEWLPVFGIEYEWMPSLGGWDVRHYEPYAEQMGEVGVDLAAYSKGAFPKQRIGCDRPERCDPDHPAWTNQGLYDYAWYTSIPEFLDGAERLIWLYRNSEKRVAIMCCEALWWKCHRSMIADYLFFRDVFCGHLPPKPPVRPTTRRFKPHAECMSPEGKPSRLVRYPAAVLDAWATRLP